MNDKPITVTLVFAIPDLSASSFTQVEEITDRAREQGAILLLRVDNIPSSVTLEESDGL